MTPPTSSSYDEYQKMSGKVTEIVLRETKSSGIHQEKLQQALLDTHTSIQHASKDCFGVLRTFRLSIKANSDLRNLVKFVLEEGSHEDARSCIQDVLLKPKTYATQEIKDRVRKNLEKAMEDSVVLQKHHDIVEDGRLTFNECSYGKGSGNSNKNKGFAEQRTVMGGSKK
tara:strand:+ start:127 stop:636 length:510 start_codon:yes stop_codon:yes gene_type:complete